MTLYSPSGKFSRVDSGDMMLPACCASCGSVENVKGFVDTKLDYEFYGVVYFCAQCAFEMTQVFNDSPYEQLVEQINALQKRIIELEAYSSKLEVIIDGVSGKWLTGRGYSSLGDVPGISDVSTEQSEQPTLDDAPEESGGTDSKSSESVKKSGPNDTSSTKRGNSTAILDI